MCLALILNSYGVIGPHQELKNLNQSYSMICLRFCSLFLEVTICSCLSSDPDIIIIIYSFLIRIRINYYNNAGLKFFGYNFTKLKKVFLLNYFSKTK